MVTGLDEDVSREVGGPQPGARVSGRRRVRCSNQVTPLPLTGGRVGAKAAIVAVKVPRMVEVTHQLCRSAENHLTIQGGIVKDGQVLEQTAARVASLYGEANVDRILELCNRLTAAPDQPISGEAKAIDDPPGLIGWQEGRIWRWLEGPPACPGTPQAGALVKRRWIISPASARTRLVAVDHADEHITRSAQCRWRVQDKVVPGHAIGSLDSPVSIGSHQDSIAGIPIAIGVLVDDQIHHIPCVDFSVAKDCRDLVEEERKIGWRRGEAVKPDELRAVGLTANPEKVLGTAVIKQQNQRILRLPCLRHHGAVECWIHL